MCSFSLIYLSLLLRAKQFAAISWLPNISQITHTKGALGDGTFWFLFLGTIACSRNLFLSCIKICNLSTLKCLTFDMFLFPKFMWCPQYLQGPHMTVGSMDAWPDTPSARRCSQSTGVQVSWEMHALGGSRKSNKVTMAISLTIFFFFHIRPFLISLGNFSRFLLLKLVQ